MAFKCNKCWSSIAKSGYVTTCSHMFCFKCSKDWFSNNEECPTCGHVLKSEGDLRPVRLDRIDLAPLGTTLWGLSPTQILEVGASALGFWEYQKRQEIAYQQRRVAHKDKKNHDIVTAANEKLVRAQNVINSQRQRLHAAREQLRRKVAEASSLMGEVKETTRQRDRFSELYNAARGRAVTAPQVRSPRPMTAAALTRQSHDRPNGSSAKTPISQARSAKSLVPAPSLRRSPGHRFASLRSTTPGLTTRTPVAARLSPMRRVPATPSLRGFSPLVSRRDPTGRRRGRRTPRTPRSPAHNSFVVLGAAGRDSR